MRKEFTGMLPGAVEKFEELMTAVQDLNPQVQAGYDSLAGPDSYSYWGCACRITCSDMAQLRTQAEALGITWLSDSGDMAYTGGRTIDEFKTFRVNGDLDLTPEEEAL